MISANVENPAAGSPLAGTVGARPIGNDIGLKSAPDSVYEDANPKPCLPK